MKTELFPLSISLFNACSLFYLLSTLFYIVFLAKRHRTIGTLASGTAWTGLAANTAALVLRWIAAGWDHPPFTNLYESLVFFAWGIALVYLLFEWKYQHRVVGAFVLTMALAAMGLASLSPNKEIEPLVPALQSWWLHIHVITASIGYAAFVVAFGFSIAFLLKDRIDLSRFGIAAGLLQIFTLILGSQGSILTRGIYQLTRVTFIEGNMQVVQDPTGHHAASITIPGVGTLLLIALVLYLAATILFFIKTIKQESQIGTHAFTVVGAAFGAQSLGIGWLVFKAGIMEEASLSANPYGFTLLVLAWAAVGFLLLFTWKYDGLLGLLPETEVLDTIEYKSIMVGFPFMTLLIVTGAIWANYAWGRYWGWDPKETWSLITWLIYAVYLHARFTAGWRGRRTAYLSIIGFISVIFTYLGVNIFLSGLHSYGSG